MPMFYTPKPRQFKYQPRFYDPEKERWEALKQKYAEERARRELLEGATADATDTVTETAADVTTGDVDLEYFERRVREINNEERSKERKLTWKDLFRKREMPKWNYQPRFQSGEQKTENVEQGTGERIAQFKKSRISIKRRFDVTDEDYLKPIPAGRIMLYALLVCLLLYWILF